MLGLLVQPVNAQPMVVHIMYIIMCSCDTQFPALHAEPARQPLHALLGQAKCQATRCCQGQK